MKYFLFALSLFAVGCSFQKPVPQGFAAYTSGKITRAVHPEDIVYRVKKVSPDQEASLDYWKSAVKTRMLASGYKLIEEGFLDKGGKQFLYSFAAPYGTETYNYWVSFYLEKENIVLTEIAGPAQTMEVHSQVLRKSILEQNK